MERNEELEKQIALIEDDEVLDCTVIFKDDPTDITSVNIAMGSYDESVSDVADEEIFFYANGVKYIRGLCDPDNGEDFVLASFHGRKADYSTSEDLVYKNNGWTLCLEGYMVGGEWVYRVETPDGKHYEATNVWNFEDSDGNPLETPVIKSFDELLEDAIEVLANTHNLTELPEDGWVLKE